VTVAPDAHGAGRTLRQIVNVVSPRMQLPPVVVEEILALPTLARGIRR